MHWDVVIVQICLTATCSKKKQWNLSPHNSFSDPGAEVREHQRHSAGVLKRLSSSMIRMHADNHRKQHCTRGQTFSTVLKAYRLNSDWTMTDPTAIIRQLIGKEKTWERQKSIISTLIPCRDETCCSTAFMSTWWSRNVPWQGRHPVWSTIAGIYLCETQKSACRKNIIALQH